MYIVTIATEEKKKLSSGCVLVVETSLGEEVLRMAEVFLTVQVNARPLPPPQVLHHFGRW
jgi:hypothetical protein